MYHTNLMIMAIPCCDNNLSHLLSDTLEVITAKQTQASVISIEILLSMFQQLSVTAWRYSQLHLSLEIL